MKLVGWLLVFACVVLLFSAVLHSIGVRFVFPALDKSNLPASLQGALKTMWWLFSLELAFVGVLSGWLSRRPVVALIWLCFLVTAISDILGLIYVGVFIATELLTLASLLLLAAAIVQMRSTATVTSKL